MSYPKVRTTPDLSLNSEKHKSAIADGNAHFTNWASNVVDHFKDKSTDEIKNSLKETANPFAICCENWISDFNFSSLIRNANGFNAGKVFYIGNKKYDKRGAVGTFNYTDVEFLPSIDDLVNLKSKYYFVGIDNVPNSVSVVNYNWRPNSLMIFGSEGTGLTKEIISLCEDIVSIPMMGSVRSFNCSTASGIVMYDYISKMVK